MSELIIREIEAKSIITKTDIPVCDYAVNPYVGCTHGCKYCYASFMKRFTNHPEPWGEFLDVKYWPELRKPEKYAGKEMFFGTVTDPYNPQEEQYRRTRTLLEQLQGSGIKLSIQTKSDLVLRDVDLIRTFPEARVGFSINTLDEDFRADMDRAVSIERRLAAMKVLHEAGIRTTCFISPIFPGITDVEAIVDAVIDRCDEIWCDSLNMRDVYKSRIMEYIERRYQTLLPLYKSIYDDNDRGYWDDLIDEIKKIADERMMRCECGDGSTGDTKMASGLFTDCHDDGRDDGVGDGCCDMRRVGRNGASCGVIKCFFAKGWRERGGDDDADYNVKESEMTQLAANLFNYNS